MSSASNSGFPVLPALSPTFLSYVRNAQENRRNPRYLPWGEAAAVFNGHLFAFLLKKYDFYPPFVATIGSIAGKVLATPLLFSALGKPLSLDRSYAILSSCWESIMLLAFSRMGTVLTSYGALQKKRVFIFEVFLLFTVLIQSCLRDRLEKKRNPLFNATLNTCCYTTFYLINLVVYRLIASFIPSPSKEANEQEKKSRTKKWALISLALSPFLDYAYGQLGHFYGLVTEMNTRGGLLERLFLVQQGFLFHSILRDPAISPFSASAKCPL